MGKQRNDWLGRRQGKLVLLSQKRTNIDIFPKQQQQQQQQHVFYKLL